MSAPRPLRFSIQMPMADDRAAWIEKVKRAEDSGFYSISVPDHLGPMLPQLAPLVALGVAAGATSTIRLAITVLDNDFRHPVMLAKEVATLDLLSEGRVDMGIGAGWLEEDYTKTGVATWDAAGTRVSRLFESVGLLRQLFAGQPVTFKGDFYEVTDFTSYPTPIQSPLPVMVGARGKRMLSWAAQHAQIISVLAAATPGGSLLQGFEEQLGFIEAAGGRERDDLMVGIRIPFGEIAKPGETTKEVAERFGAARGMTTDEVLASPFAVVGEPSSVRDHLLEIAERYGIQYFTVSEDLAWPLAPIVQELAR